MTTCTRSMAAGLGAVAALLLWTAGVASAQKAVLNRCAGGARPTGSCPLNTDPFAVGNIPTACQGQLASGLRVIVGETGALQIHRQGVGQLFGGCEIPPSSSLLNGFYLAAAADVYGTLHDQAPLVVGNSRGLKAAWATVSQAPVDGDGSPAKPFSSITVMSGGGYELAVAVTYEVPSDDIALKLTLTPPAGSSTCVKLYHALDTRLGGADRGPALVHPSSADPQMVGVQSTFPSVNEAFVEASPLWDYFHSGDFKTMYSDVLRGADLGDVNDIDPDTDNGIGVQWELCPASPGATMSVSYLLRFTTRLGGPAGGPGCASGGSAPAVPLGPLGLLLALALLVMGLRRRNV